MTRPHLIPALALLIHTAATPLVEAAPVAAVRVGAPAVVNCGPGRHAVVRHVVSRGRRVERLTCAPAVRRTQAVRHRVPHRSWKKSALVIGGATAAGAGAGALVGGKKGALIGAAAGGAAGTAYEVHKRHRRSRRHY